MALDDGRRHVHLTEHQHVRRRGHGHRRRVGQVERRQLFVGLVRGLRLQVLDDGIQVAAGPSERVHDLLAAGLQDLDLLTGQIPAPGQVAEDALADGPGLRDHLPALELGRLDLALGLVLRLLAAPGGLDLGVAPEPGRVELGVAQQPARGLVRSGPDLCRRLVGRGQDARRLLTELGGDRGLVEVLGGLVTAGLSGLLQLPHQPVPVVLGPTQLLGDAAQEVAHGRRLEALAGHREARTGHGPGGRRVRHVSRRHQLQRRYQAAGGAGMPLTSPPRLASAVRASSTVCTGMTLSELPLASSAASFTWSAGTRK